jgi:hypothetical protein
MIKKCEKCNTEFDAYSKYGEKRFCSRKCANSRVFSEESKLKKSLALKGKKTGLRGGLTEEKFNTKVKKYKEKVQKRLFEIPFEELGFDRKRRRVFAEQNYCCNKCGISEWQEFKISLELEHKDGNNQNNDRDNLEGLCPNCHSITDTWRGRNKPKRNGINNVSDKFLLECLSSSPTIRQGLLKAGLSAKGNNYERAKKLLSVM